ncbi:multicopper oxidase [Phanerochaete sordida]|uniref:laccase n=1 Tax=Phanerochaete sordida TaxID=48140 RepID=A0A9P3GMD5_9APHY|nr:multicopper oxidase [Phanerochaete sordida]
MQPTAHTTPDRGHRATRNGGRFALRTAALCLPLVLAAVLLALAGGADARSLTRRHGAFPHAHRALPIARHAGPHAHNATVHTHNATAHAHALARNASAPLVRRDTVATPAASSFVVGSIIGEAPTTRTFDFTITEIDGSPDGFSKSMLVVNGQFPGPTIEANQGDTISVTVTNSMSTATTIHWHGIYQNGTNYYDGTASVTECGIPAGSSQTYTFSVADFSGTTWWHAHATQYTDGIEGPLIVHPTSYPSGFPTWDEDIVIALTDVYHTFSSTIAQQYTQGGGTLSALELEVPDSGAINGVGQYDGSTDYFNLNLESGKTYRLRLIHMGSAAQIRFSIDYHALTVIEADSTLTQSDEVEGITLNVAQRYSVLVTTNQDAEPAGDYWIRAELISAASVSGTTTDIRGIMRYANSTADPTTDTDPGVPGAGLSDLDDTALVPAVATTPPDSTKSYTVDFSIAVDSAGATSANMNGTVWSPLSGTSTLLQIVNSDGSYAPEGASIQSTNQFMITEDDIQVVDLLLVNGGAGVHPFHLHGHSPYILGSGTGTYDGTGLNTVNPLNRDTYAVPSNGWLVARFVTDNPGIWTIHCHIAWHMEAGLLMQINSLPSKSSQFDIPSDIVSFCSS